MRHLNFFLLFINPLVASALGLWPEPVRVTTGTTVLWMSPHVKLFFSCADETVSMLPHQSLYLKLIDSLTYLDTRKIGSEDGEDSSTSLLSEKKILASAFRRTSTTVASTKFVPWKFYSRTVDFEPAKDEPRRVIESVHINQVGAMIRGNISAAEFFAGDESYNLTISEGGLCKINTRSTLGSLRALQTMEQLFYAHSDGSGVYTPFAPVDVEDSPRWPHRGLNLDISRNPFAPADVKRTIDAMASCKMSRLHIHATDSQSWPIEIPALPTLAKKGAYRSYLKWSPSDVRAVQHHGFERGVSVFLEIDMPGHTGSIFHAFPELIAAFNESDWSTFAAQPPSGSLKLDSPAVYSFLDTLLSDLLPRLSPYTTLFHNGGDEVNKNTHLLDDTVYSNSSAVLQPLIQRLMSNVTAMVTQAGLTPVVWEDMLLEWNLTFPSSSMNGSGPSDIIVQAWRGAEQLQQVVEKGYRALFGDYGNWYLDCGYGGFLNPYPSGFSPAGVPYNTSGGVSTQIEDPFLDYCEPLKNWRSIYLYNPLVNVTQDMQYLIEGGETHMWTEQVDPIELDSRIWPRAASAAEVMWSGPRNSSQLEDASRRLAEWRERAVLDHSIRAAMVQNTWCLMEGGCNL